MTIKRRSVRWISGIVLQAVFLGFLAISGFVDKPTIEQGTGDVAILTSVLAEPVAFRNTSNSGFIPGFILKAAGPCLLVGLFGFTLITRRPAIHASALKINLRRHNPFYVFISTNAP